jgi:adenylate kinase family enzyme
MTFSPQGESGIMQADSFLSQPPTGQRIVVIGTTCSGKTTLAAQLAQRLDVGHVELDALHWQPNWTETSLDAFRARVTDALSPSKWVVDGNYSKVRDIVWARADTIIWLDYTLPVILVRLTKRTLRRIITREELWNGNRETLRGTLLRRDSLLLWALKTHRRRRREIPIWLARPEHQHLTVIHLTSPRAADRWRAHVETQTEVSSPEIPHPDVLIEPDQR